MSPTDEQLRGALELCFAVAVAGTRLRPSVAPPAPLRPFMKFQRLPGSALPVVRKVAEDDDEFRLRAASVATEELVGEIGVLWLSRPEGWLEALQALVEAAVHDEVVSAGGPEAAKDRRKRALAEQAATRAKAELATLRIAFEREREQRRAAEQRARELDGRLSDLEREAETAREAARAARVRSANSAATAESAHETKRQLQDRLSELEARLEDALAGRAEAESRVAELERADASAPVAPAAASTPRPELDRAAGALQDTAGALRRLAQALELTGGALGGPEPASAVAPVSRRQPVQPSAPRRVPASRRVPLGIPGGLFGDSDAAADHLVRQPKVVLVVDGYNVAKLGWPGLSLELQRESAIASLDDLVRRISTRVIAVFDGADVPPVAARRRLVRVKFSPAGVTADDSIRELIAGLPDKLPVVVATNDQEIVQDVRQMGANVIRSEQLLALLRR